MTRLKKPMLTVFLIYGLCYIFRCIEYFIIRTDKTLLGEAVLHKLAGILVMCITIKMLSCSLSYLGFIKKGALKQLIFGLLFGLLVFTIGYGTDSIFPYSFSFFIHRQKQVQLTANAF